MTKYYLIEKVERKRRVYERDYMGGELGYKTIKTKHLTIQELETKEQLLEAYKGGPKHGGMLIPAEGLEIKLL